jgi:hypothetical protein
MSYWIGEIVYYLCIPAAYLQILGFAMAYLATALEYVEVML